MSTPDHKLRFTYAAREDFDSILFHSSTKWDPEQADRYEAAIWEVILEIVAFPESGNAVISRFPGYRRRIVGRHAIYYQVRDGEVIVERILHEKQKTEGQFDDLD
jgi:toxin ParE1/3/4